MKGWFYYLLCALRWVGALVAMVVLEFILLIILCFLIPPLNHIIFPDANCGYSSRTISPKQGNFRAVVIGKWCDDGCAYRIVLRRRDGRGPDTTIFVYNPTHVSERRWRPWTHDPAVVWLSANELEISVDRLDRIQTQLKGAQGVKIKYRIGFVDSQYAKPLALEGEKIIGLMKTRLTDSQDDWIIDDTVRVLEDMVKLESYDVAGDKELMRLVDERVKAIKDPQIKELAGQGVDTIRKWSAEARRLTALNGRDPVKRKAMFSLLRSEGFSGALDIFADFTPFGEIEAGTARLKLFLYAHNPEYDGRKGGEAKRLLIFSQGRYLGSYVLDDFPTGIKRNRLEFPRWGRETPGNVIVFDKELPPEKIHLGGKEQGLMK